MMDNVVKEINETAGRVKKAHEADQPEQPNNTADLITMTRDQFYVLREGIAGAHLLTQRVLPFLKQRHTKLDKDTMHLANVAPEPIRLAFQLSAQISTEQDGNPPDFSNRVPEPLQDIDVKTMRNEIENVSALNMPDLVHDMCCAINELPGLNVLSSKPMNPPYAEGAMCAIVWEAGRRYGMIEALSVFDLVSAEFTEGTRTILEKARDRSLELTLAPNPSDAPPLSDAKTKAFQAIADHNRTHPGPEPVN